jgi:NADH-quinone oxidoreductase subunit M
MIELHLPWLELAIAAPLFGAAWTSRAVNVETAQRRSVAVCGLTLGLVLLAWFDLTSLHVVEAHDRWSISQRILGLEPFILDELNAPLLPLGAFLYFSTSIATLRTKAERFSFAGALVSESILLATLSCFPGWGIVGLLLLGCVPPWLELRSRGRSTRVYSLHMGLFAVLLVAGWALVAATPAGRTPSLAGVALLTAAVLIRCGIVPAHCWMTDLFEKATFGTALLFVTPMVGVYAAVRLLLPVAPEGALRTMALVSLLTAVYAAGMALVQREARRFFCYLFLSHSSLVLVGLEIATPIGLTGALCLWISVGLALTGFGLTLRAVEARQGSISLRSYHGLYEHTPSLAGFFLITGLASIGFPGTIGFVGAELLLEGAVDVYPYVGFAVVLAGALNGIAVIQAYFRVFSGRRFDVTVSLRSRLPERLAVLGLTVLILGGGLIPQPGLASRHRAALRVIETRQAAGLVENSGAEPTGEEDGDEEAPQHHASSELTVEADLRLVALSGLAQTSAVKSLASRNPVRRE